MFEFRREARRPKRLAADGSVLEWDRAREVWVTHDEADAWHVANPDEQLFTPSNYDAMRDIRRRQ